MISRSKFRLSRSSGYTLLELIIASTIGVVTIGVSATAILSNRGLLLRDTARLEVNQSLRASLDIIGADIRQGGENLVIQEFPVIELNNNALNGQDELIVRSSPLLDTLFVCQDATNADLLVGDTTVGGVAACPPAGRSLDPADELPDNMFLWDSYRQDLVAQGEPTTAYIFDSDSFDGELFEVDSIFRTAGTTGNDPAEYFVRSTSGAWAGTYDAAGDRPYIAIVNERRYFLDAQGFLTTQINNGPNQNMANGITDFQIVITTQDGTQHTDFRTADGDRWSDIQSVQITISGSSEFATNREVDNTVSAQFLPRNVMSFPR